MYNKEADTSNFVRQPPHYSEYVSKMDRNGKTVFLSIFCILDRAVELPDQKCTTFFHSIALYVAVLEQAGTSEIDNVLLFYVSGKAPYSMNCCHADSTLA